jgi:hypothetical protein
LNSTDLQLWVPMPLIFSAAAADFTADSVTGKGVAEKFVKNFTKFLPHFVARCFMRIARQEVERRDSSMPAASPDESAPLRLLFCPIWK